MTTATRLPHLDLRQSKAKQQRCGRSGDFAVIGTTLQIVGELLCEAADVGGGERCSTSPRATATPRWPPRALRAGDLHRLRPGAARRRPPPARAEGLDVTFEVADAEALPYAAASYRRRSCRPSA
jgi:hypothetical protein